MMSRKPGLAHRTVTGMFWTASGKAVRSGLQVMVLVVLARLVSPTDFGVVNAALVFIGFSAIFAQVGLGPALVQRPVLEPRHLRSAFAVSVYFGLLFGVVIWSIAPLVTAFFRMPPLEPVLRTLAWTFPLRGLGIVSQSLMQREMRFRWLASREVASFAIGYGLVGSILAFQGGGVWALVVANLAQTGSNTLLLLIGRRPLVGLWPERQAFRELVYFGGGFTAARVANYLAGQGDNLVVGRWLGPAALGIYGRAYQLMAVPAAAVGEVLDTVLFPAMASVQDDVQRVAVAYRKGVSLIALTILPASVLLFGLAPEVVDVLLGPQWTAVVAPLQILTVGMLFRCSYKMSDSICRATGAVYRRAWRQAVYAGLVLGGSWVGHHWGVAGVAAGVLLAVTVNFVSMAHLSLSVSGITWGTLFRAHVPALLLSAACAVVLTAILIPLRQLEVAPLLRLVAAAGGTLSAGLALAWVAPRTFLGGDGLWMLETLRSYLPKRLNPSGPAPS
jgi:O-antigen/teichoic acid export membrane protein